MIKTFSISLSVIFKSLHLFVHSFLCWMSFKIPKNRFLVSFSNFWVFWVFFRSVFWDFLWFSSFLQLYSLNCVLDNAERLFEKPNSFCIEWKTWHFRVFLAQFISCWLIDLLRWSCNNFRVMTWLSIYLLDAMNGIVIYAQSIEILKIVYIEIQPV